jgi:hypothetical protein
LTDLYRLQCQGVTRLFFRVFGVAATSSVYIVKACFSEVDYELALLTFLTAAGLGSGSDAKAKGGGGRQPINKIRQYRSETK